MSSNATDPENAIEIDDADAKQQAMIHRLIGEGVIKAIDRKYYFDLAGEEQYSLRATRHNLCVILALVLLIACLLLALSFR